MRKRGVIGGIFAAGLIATSVAHSQAATLRNASVITSGTVRLSDLFADLDPGQDRALGPGPAPGASIQVGGAQLLAIADQYGVDWLDQSPNAVATITRASRVLDQAYFADLIRQNLPELGNGPVSIDLRDFHPMMVAPDDPKPVVLSDVKWDQRSGWFSATVYRGQPSGDITQDSFMLTGVIHAARRLLVYAHALPAGSVISASDVQIDESYAGHISSRAYTEEADIDGMTVTHGVVAGSPVLDQDLHRTVLMHKGDPAMITFAAPGVHLTATGRALEDGGAGQYIRILNVSSGMIVTGRVVNASEIEVEAGSNPVPSDGNTLRRLTAPARNASRADLSLR
ncbi:flagellar basal body P-ring formation protein FlgA [Gluconacetobacter sp. 1b LMG 1731]|uniref:Flagellar basal body P-ring formation protein FlgA n=1 Tax=Gluconacetobacter dulcium TaxID=2729096 RepID=A0A7W4IHW7_9PROT|nr:flagellar basal body P-ring formation chaperone FlgA [Gluconacetobacter dulcium]MBB2163087.1 flagellar basal body P-ring formation protein FlgA [Gluconacetobacter dulcium]MBB2192218.1 flagellar basal body P-ring formation protein FlgA [Gluconacetobacter dulcium]